MTQPLYDGIKGNPEFQYLYSKWMKYVRNDRTDDWYSFRDFYSWTMLQGFEIGDRLIKIDPTKPHSPNNSTWVTPYKSDDGYTEKERAWICLWNQTVNRIRVACNMQPL